MKLALGNVPNLKHAKLSFAQKILAGVDTSFTLKGLRFIVNDIRLVLSYPKIFTEIETIRSRWCSSRRVNYLLHTSCQWENETRARSRCDRQPGSGTSSLINVAPCMKPSERSGTSKRRGESWHRAGQQQLPFPRRGRRGRWGSRLERGRRRGDSSLKRNHVRDVGTRRHEAVKDALVTAGAEHRELPETLHRRGRPLRSHEGNSDPWLLPPATYLSTYVWKYVRTRVNRLSPRSDGYRRWYGRVRRDEDMYNARTCVRVQSCYVRASRVNLQQASDARVSGDEIRVQLWDLTKCWQTRDFFNRITIRDE